METLKMISKEWQWAWQWAFDPQLDERADLTHTSTVFAAAAAAATAAAAAAKKDVLKSDVMELMIKVTRLMHWTAWDVMNRTMMEAIPLLDVNTIQSVRHYLILGEDLNLLDNLLRLREAWQKAIRCLNNQQQCQLTKKFVACLNTLNSDIDDLAHGIDTVAPIRICHMPDHLKRKMLEWYGSEYVKEYEETYFL